MVIRDGRSKSAGAISSPGGRGNRATRASKSSTIHGTRPPSTLSIQRKMRFIKNRRVVHTLKDVARLPLL